MFYMSINGVEVLQRKKRKPPSLGGFQIILRKDKFIEITSQRKEASGLFRGGNLWEGKLMGYTNGREELFSKISYVDFSWCRLILGDKLFFPSWHRKGRVRRGTFTRVIDTPLFRQIEGRTGDSLCVCFFSAAFSPK